MLEIMVVVLIIVIVAFMTAPAVAGMVRRSRLAGSASTVATALRRARSAAIESGRPCHAWFRTSRKPQTVELYLVGEGQAGTASPTDWTDARYVEEFELEEDMIIQIIASDPPQTYVFFLPDGSGWGGPGFYVPTTIRVHDSTTGGGRRYEIGVSNLAGRISLELKGQ